MSEVGLLREWTEADPSVSVGDRRDVLRFLLECEKDTLSEVGTQEIVTFFLLNVREKGPAKARYTRSLVAFCDWATAAGFFSENPALLLAESDGRPHAAPGPVRECPLALSGILRDYRSFLVATGGSPNTAKQYTRWVLRLVAMSPTAGSLEEIGEEGVIALLEPYAPRAAAREIAFHALRSFYTWAARRGHVAADPTEGLSVKGPQPKDPDAYAPEEIVALLDAAPNPKHRAAILLAYSLGLRRSEACGLTPDDVDWVNGRVHIRPEIAKGNRGRFVEMNELAVEAIEALRPYWTTTLLGGMDRGWFTMLVNQTATRAGFPPGRRNSHLLRSSFATHLLGNGVPISVVSRLLGHVQVATTSRYLAVTGLDRRDAVGTLTLPPTAAAAKSGLRWKSPIERKGA